MDSLSDIQQKLVDHLNRKSYSRFELVQKLMRFFSEEEAEAACDWATGLDLIERPKEMAERYAAELSR
ncbi:MAG: hypothetical protein K2X47_20275, partial [Bdellovibrionales bacterium]|nr:hypothetical protein [Bdellovibrionales bacterium]